MTIKGLYKLIKTRAPDAVTTVPLKSLSGTYIFIDASLYIYKWIATGIANKIYNENGDHVNHIQGCIWQVCALVAAGIKPVYVFDGPPPAEKRELIEQRKTARDAGTSIRVPSAAFTAVAKLLELMGVTAITATGEAEATAAALARAHGGAVATEDSDCLLFGAPRMVRDISDTVVVIELDGVLAGLDMTMPELVDLGIILGSDYTDKPAKIGPARGYKLVQQYHTIEAALNVGAFVAPPRFDYTAARAIFTAEPLISADLGAPGAGGQANIGALAAYITAHGLKYARFSTALNVLKTE